MRPWLSRVESRFDPRADPGCTLKLQFASCAIYVSAGPASLRTTNSTVHRSLCHRCHPLRTTGPRSDVCRFQGAFRPWSVRPRPHPVSYPQIYFLLPSCFLVGRSAMPGSGRGQMNNIMTNIWGLSTVASVSTRGEGSARLTATRGRTSQPFLPTAPLTALLHIAYGAVIASGANPLRARLYLPLPLHRVPRLWSWPGMGGLEVARPRRFSSTPWGRSTDNYLLLLFNGPNTGRGCTIL